MQCVKLRLAGQFMVWNDMAKKSESISEKRFDSLTKVKSLFCSKLNIHFSKYTFSNVCRKILLPTFVVLQNSSTSPHPTPHWWESFILDLATGLLKSTQWPFLGAGQNKGKIQVRLSFHLWFDLSAQACGAWNLSAGRDEWNRRSKLIRFSNDWVPSFPSHQAPWKNNKW